MKLEITTIGNSAGVILPKELLARLRLEKGDELFALEIPDGIELTVFDPELAAQMEWPRRSCARIAPCCTSWRSSCRHDHLDRKDARLGHP